WLLEPGVLQYLSPEGKQAALYVYEILKKKRRPNYGMADNQILPLASAPGYNLRVNNPSLDRFGNAQSETTVAANGNNLVVSFNDTGNFNVIFLDINLSGYAFSTNGGL